MSQAEDPAVLMARRLLFNAYKQREEAKMSQQQRMTHCSECGKEIPVRGSRAIKIDGKRVYFCADCDAATQEDKDRKTNVPAVVVGVKGRRSCFFCNHDKFYLNLSGAIECAECGSMFFKGRQS